ncbi:hypothetical protein AXF42_Ash000573 [Apostasia shenzhenica]|uniref:Uncharacterized protein n=1 Tax=Apostasia shenzhenica TaxID=1088818 RepID=A0A2I0AGS9_9ASPA|nr:hypothetical protein AXF42_Ash000573 [Apostasia shenzhenica]
MAIKGELSGQGIHILIDSESTHNFVDPGVLKGAEGLCESVSNQLIKLAAGATLRTQHMVRGLKWKMCGIEFSADVMIILLGSYDIILGVQWLTTLGPILWNFQQLVMEFQYQGHKILLRGSRKKYIKIIDGKKIRSSPQNSTILMAIHLCSIKSDFNLHKPRTVAAAKHLT